MTGVLVFLAFGALAFALGATPDPTFREDQDAGHWMTTTVTGD